MNLPSAPTNFQSTTVAAIFIILTWSQPAGEVVDYYVISYFYQTPSCPGEEGMSDVLMNGSVRQYNLSGLQENSVYTINITARNGAGSSAHVKITRNTLVAGKIIARWHGHSVAVLLLAVVFPCSSYSSTRQPLGHWNHFQQHHGHMEPCALSTQEH